MACWAGCRVVGDPASRVHTEVLWGVVQEAVSCGGAAREGDCGAGGELEGEA